MKHLGLVLLLLAPVSAFTKDTAPHLDLVVPELVGIDEPFEITVSVTNKSDSSLTFKRHHRWSDETWFLEFEDTEGVRTKSRPGLGRPPDPPCSNYIALDPTRTVSFDYIVNEGLPPHHRFGEAGQYRVRLIYMSVPGPLDEECSIGGSPPWYGEVESDWIEILVNRKPFLETVPSDIADLPLRLQPVDPTWYETPDWRLEAWSEQRSTQTQWELPVYVSSACVEEPEVYIEETRNYITDQYSWHPGGPRFVGGLKHLRVDFICSSQYRFLLASSGSVGNHGILSYTHRLRAWWLLDGHHHDDFRFRGYHVFSLGMKDEGESVELRYAASGDCGDCHVQLVALVHLSNRKPTISVEGTK